MAPLSLIATTDIPGVGSLPISSPSYKPCSASPAAPSNLFSNCYGNFLFGCESQVPCSNHQIQRPPPHKVLRQIFQIVLQPSDTNVRMISFFNLLIFMHPSPDPQSKSVSVQRLRYLRPHPPLEQNFDSILLIPFVRFLLLPN